MQVTDDCKWYLIKTEGNEFAVQYTGPDPDTAFPVDMDGIMSWFGLT